MGDRQRDFSRLLRDAADELNLSSSLIAVAFQTSPRIVNDWINGLNEPPTNLQEKVVRWLERRLKRQNRIEKNKKAIYNGAIE
jgi:hypothetical protein